MKRVLCASCGPSTSSPVIPKSNKNWLTRSLVSLEKKSHQKVFHSSLFFCLPLSFLLFSSLFFSFLNLQFIDPFFPFRFFIAEDIDKMPYLFNVLRESLRFCPPIPYVVRRASEDVNLGGYTIPKNVCISPFPSSPSLPLSLSSLLFFYPSSPVLHFSLSCPSLPACFTLPPPPSLPSLLPPPSSFSFIYSPLQTIILINIHHMHHHSPVWDHPETFSPERYFPPLFPSFYLFYI